MECEHRGNCHWIIMKDDQTAIWKRPYKTKEDAQTELAFRDLIKYHVEHRKNQFQFSSTKEEIDF